MNRYMILSILYVTCISCMKDQSKVISEIIKQNNKNGERISHCFHFLNQGIDSPNITTHQLKQFTKTTLEINETVFLFLLDQQTKSNLIISQQQQEIKALLAQVRKLKHKKTKKTKK